MHASALLRTVATLAVLAVSALLVSVALAPLGSLTAVINHPHEAAAILLPETIATLAGIDTMARKSTVSEPASAKKVSKKTGKGEIVSSIIVPAYHEAANIGKLTERLFKSVKDPKSVELIIVDDNSRDGSEEAVEKLAKEGYNVRIIVRTKERGLSSAVLTGFQEAKGEKLICMDADLQHPPERVQAFLDGLDASTFVLGTRYGAGVEMDRNWPFYRRVISAGARYLARPLTSASDPMTGFFGIQKSVFQGAEGINRKGFKIALDLLVKSQVPRSSVSEVAYSFGVRTVGESKLSGKVIIFYVLQLLELYVFKFGLWPCILAVAFLAIAAVLVLEKLFLGTSSVATAKKVASAAAKAKKRN